jgi:hypothetical protein
MPKASRWVLSVRRAKIADGMAWMLLVAAQSGPPPVAGSDWRDYVAVAELVVTIVGFALTAVAIWRTRQAVQNVRRSLINNQVLILMPFLERIEWDLQRAVDDLDWAMTVHQLQTWRWQAGHVSGLVQAIPNIPSGFMSALRKSVALAAVARTGLAKTDLLDKGTKQVRTAIADVTNQIGEVTAHLSIQVYGGGGS